MNRRILLITSTILPEAGVHALVHTDPSLRLAEYRKALKFYSQLIVDEVVDKIVYVDNSGYDLSILASEPIVKNISDHIEFVSYRANVEVKNNNRLFLELNLIEQAFARSALLQLYQEAIVWKVTGRYLIRNIGKIITLSQASKDCEFLVNLRSYPYPVIDFYLFGFLPKTYRQVISSNLHIYEGPKDGEILLRKAIDEFIRSGGKASARFPVVPRLTGVRGFDGARYGGCNDTLKYLIRVGLNRVAPKFWI